MIKRRRHVLLIAWVALVPSLALAGLEGSAASVESAAIVSHVSGRVSVRRVGDQAPIAATRGMVLHGGDRITAEPDGDATLLVGTVPLHLGARPGRTWTAGEPVTVPGPGIAERIRNLFARPGPSSRPGGAEFRGLPEGLRARPLRGQVVAEKLAFEWTPVPGVSRFRLSLREELSARPGPLHSEEVSGSRWIVPAGLLAAGRSYVWTLEPVGGKGLPVRNRFTVVTPRERERVLAGDPDPRAKARRLARAGFLDDALEVYLAAPSSESSQSAVADLLRRAGARE